MRRSQFSQARKTAPTPPKTTLMAHRALKAHTSTQRPHKALKAHTSTQSPSHSPELRHSTAAGSMRARVDLKLILEAHMRRRDFLKAIPLAVLMPHLHAMVRLKITGIRIIKLKVVRETGKMEAAWDPGTVTTWRIGGGSIVEVHTDQGLSGIRPGVSP